MKESRNRDNNTKKTEYILNERCKFFLKLSMTKKTVVRNFGENRRKLFSFLSKFFSFLSKFAQNLCPPPIFVTKLFAPPNIYHKSTPVHVQCLACRDRIC